MTDTTDTLRIAVEADTNGFERALADLSLRATSFGSALSQAFRGAVVGGRTLEGTMRQLGQRISSIALDAALRPLTGAAGSLVGQALSGLARVSRPADGAPARVVPFAKGGVVRAPSFFPMAGGTGLMGEAGAEAILPLRRGADGSLGVASEGGAGRGGPSIVFNVQTPDAASFRRSEAQIQTMIARAAARGQRGL